MPKPLVRDDEPDPVQQPPQREPVNLQPYVEKGENVWSLLRRFGGWLSKQRLPEGAKKGLKEEWHYIWTNDRKPQRGQKKEKYFGRPFVSFGVKDEKKRKR